MRETVCEWQCYLHSSTPWLKKLVSQEVTRRAWLQGRRHKHSTASLQPWWQSTPPASRTVRVRKHGPCPRPRTWCVAQTRVHLQCGAKPYYTNTASFHLSVVRREAGESPNMVTRRYGLPRPLPHYRCAAFSRGSSARVFSAYWCGGGTIDALDRSRAVNKIQNWEREQS